MTLDRQRGCLIGLAVGDALGAAIEFRAPGTFKPVTGYRSGGPHGLPDASPSLRLDPRYAVRVANRDVVWWTDAEGRYEINVLGTLQIAE